MTDVRRPLYRGRDTFDHDAVCRLIFAARGLVRCAMQEGSFGGQRPLNHARNLDRLAKETKAALEAIPGSGSINGDGGYD